MLLLLVILSSFFCFCFGEPDTIDFSSIGSSFPFGRSVDDIPNPLLDPKGCGCPFEKSNMLCDPDYNFNTFGQDLINHKGQSSMYKRVRETYLSFVPPPKPTRTIAVVINKIITSNIDHDLFAKHLLDKYNLELNNTQKCLLFVSVDDNFMTVVANNPMSAMFPTPVVNGLVEYIHKKQRQYGSSVGSARYNLDKALGEGIRVIENWIESNGTFLSNQTLTQPHIPIDFDLEDQVTVAEIMKIYDEKRLKRRSERWNPLTILLIIFSLLYLFYLTAAISEISKYLIARYQDRVQRIRREREIEDKLQSIRNWQHSVHGVLGDADRCSICLEDYFEHTVLNTHNDDDLVNLEEQPLPNIQHNNTLHNNTNTLHNRTVYSVFSIFTKFGNYFTLSTTNSALLQHGQQPLKLRCRHQYCSACLRDFIVRGRHRCPQCPGTVLDAVVQ